jgi:ribosomal protein S8
MIDKWTYNYISQLNTASKTDKQNIRIKKTKKNKTISAFFLKIGIISYYTISEDNKSINVFLRGMNSMSKKHYLMLESVEYATNVNKSRPFRHILVISKKTLEYNTKYKDLYRMNNIDMLYILNTKKGLLTSKEAVQYHCGGELCFKILL